MLKRKLIMEYFNWKMEVSSWWPNFILVFWGSAWNIDFLQSVMYMENTKTNLQLVGKKNVCYSHMAHFLYESVKCYTTKCQATFHFVQLCTSKDWVNMDAVFVIISCEVHDVINFLQTEGHNAAEINRRVCHMYIDNVMYGRSVTSWCRKSGMDGQIQLTMGVGVGERTTLSYNWWTLSRTSIKLCVKNVVSLFQIFLRSLFGFRGLVCIELSQTDRSRSSWKE